MNIDVKIIKCCSIITIDLKRSSLYSSPRRIWVIPKYEYLIIFGSMSKIHFENSLEK